MINIRKKTLKKTNEVKKNPITFGYRKKKHFVFFIIIDV